LEDTQLLAEILNEVRACRQDIREQAERLSTLEATTYPALKNNGQPSLLSKLDTRITELERKHWRFVGWLSGVYLAVSLAAAFAIEYVKAKFLGH
jgi:hypothetical protein